MARYEAASSIIGNLAFKKALFQSPSPVPEGSKASVGAGSEIIPSMSLVYKVQLEQDIDMNLYYIKKDLNVHRLKDLRELANTLPEDNWQFESAEKLTGLQ